MSRLNVMARSVGWAAGWLVGSSMVLIGVIVAGLHIAIVVIWAAQVAMWVALLGKAIRERRSIR